MKRPTPNMSAALAIAIERQVESIIADAKAECARLYQPYPRATRFPSPREIDAAAAQIWTAGKLGEALRRGSERAEFERGFVDPSAASARVRRRDFWGRLLSLFGTRSPRA